MKRALFAGLPAALLAGLLWWDGRAVAVDLRTPRDLHRSPFIGSAACQKCHQGHDASWRRTFHRTMTRQATPAFVLGDFGGRSYRYGGVTARMDRDAAGGYRMTFSPDDGPARSVKVERTVGSRRYQQYLARRGNVFFRLPIAWHVEEGRWFHMNGAFLTPDPDEPPAGRSIARIDYDRHVVRWNDNCIFCHNVGPDPGQDPGSGKFDTRVAELGIACEACHGPGGEHARRNADPVRRYALHASAGADPTIVNPARLPPPRAADLCGRCHGQRITDDVGRFMQHGDPFVPGEDLALYSAPLWRETPLDGDARAFELRFWSDGTPRLTAYEYQGLLQSPCSQRGAMTCTSCHGMHTGDPRGQIAPRAEGDAGCTQCHAALASDEAKRRHAHHDPRGSGARCVGCHLPRVVYGVLDVHRSHRVEIPDPVRDAARGRPDACTGCHVDESRLWAMKARERLWGGPPAPRIALFSGPATWALEGDPIERAIAADAIGRPEAAPGSAHAIGQRLATLFDVMERDDYPAVRRIAWRAARRLTERVHPGTRPAWMAYDPTGPAAERAVAAREIAAALPSGAVGQLDRTVVAELRARAKAAAIEIGE